MSQLFSDMYMFFSQTRQTVLEMFDGIVQKATKDGSQMKRIRHGRHEIANFKCSQVV